MGFKDLYGVGGAAGTAGGDVEWYTGKIQSWDEITGANTVVVNGKALSNLNVVLSGNGIQYQPGDVVDVRRVQTIYTVMGKVAAPGADAGNRIGANAVSAAQSTTSTSYGDLATFGPSVTVYIGSSRRCKVTVSATVNALVNGTTPTSIYVGGNASFAVSGASSIAPNSDFYVGGETWYATNTVPVAFYQGASRVTLLDASRGLNQGFNTFTMKYLALSANPGCTFFDRTIIVEPF